MKSFSRKLLGLLMAVLLFAECLTPVFAVVDGDSDAWSDGWYTVDFTKANDGSSVLPYGENTDTLIEEEQYAPTDMVRVSIVLEDSPTIKLFATDNIAQNKAAKDYRTALKNKQDLVVQRISKHVLGGKKLDVVWNLTLVANVISAKVEYRQIAGIKAVSGVKKVVIEREHLPETAEEQSAEASPEMLFSAEMTGSYSVWAKGYTGAGTSVAVIDTGIDYEHISFNPDAFEYALGTLGEEVDLFTKEEVAAVLDQLQIKSRNPDITVDDVYLNTKIPFAYNYVDVDADVTHMNDTEGNHGSHVAGIAVANRYLPDGNGGYVEAMENVSTQGQAPDAQLMVMKVFGKNSGAFESDYMAATEDAIILGASAANLSLGAPIPGFTVSDEFEDVIDSFEQSDTVVVTSGGNSNNWAEKTYAERLYAGDKSLSMAGDPGVYYSYLTVASVDNSGKFSWSFSLFGQKVYYDDPAGFSNDPFRKLNGEYEFIAVDSIGTKEEFDALANVLPGKIAVCHRGSTSFAEKANAAVENGAVATIICNNTSGTLSMNLSNYIYRNPVVNISLEDGQFLFENAEAVISDETGEVLYYTGKLTVTEEQEYIVNDSGYYTMSSFSSWGIPGSLILKPEITAPGGSIYSVCGENLTDTGMVNGQGNNQYMYCSGTSMASPQVAGIAALIEEYIRKNDLLSVTGLSKRQLTTSLLMGTAQPLLEKSTGYYYSVLKQGAGLVNVNDVLTTHTYLSMHEDATVSCNDGKVKAELGEVARTDKTFDFTFDVNNFGKSDSEYLLYADFFTQMLVEDVEYNDDGSVKIDANGEPVTTLYTDCCTTPLEANIVWTVNGVVYSSNGAEKYDFNGDGVFTYADVQTLLDYIVGNVDAISCLENADLDNDGTVGTYDAYLALEAVKKSKITVPAGSKATVNISVELLDIDEYDINGAYIEGFVFVEEQDGAGVTSSIPVIGYYGGWADFPMFDYGSAIDYYHHTNERTPYMAAELGRTAEIVRTFLVEYDGKSVDSAVGNPFVHDEVYHPERNAISPDDKLDSIRYTLIRAAAASEVIITDEDGNVLYTNDTGRLFPAYYSASAARWYNYFGKQIIDYQPQGLEDGQVITATFRAVPEYYVLKGEVDWDSLPEGTRISQSFTIDGTSPELLSVDVHYDTKKGGFDAIRVSARDNQYIAYLKLADEDGKIIASSGSDEDAGAGKLYQRTIDLTQLFDSLAQVPDHMKITVCDYAANKTDYYINLNPRELSEDLDIVADIDSVSLFPQQTVQVVAKVTPWSKTSEILWSSDDDTVAAVNDTGLITAVGAGNTVIRATLTDNPDAHIEIAVEVVDKDMILDCVIWDESAAAWFATIDTSALPEYQKKTAEPAAVSIASLFYDEDGTLYGVTLSSDILMSELYIVDEDSYELTLVSQLQPGVVDAAAAPTASDGYGRKIMIGVYYSSVIWFDIETGNIVYAIDYSDYLDNLTFVGVAYAASYVNEEYEVPVDVYCLVDSRGTLHSVGYTKFEEDDEISELVSIASILSIGDPVDTIAFQSLYVTEDESIVWSRCNFSENTSQIIRCDLSIEYGNAICDLGRTNEGVWPAGGIYQKDSAPVLHYREMIAEDEEDGAESLPAEKESVSFAEEAAQQSSPKQKAVSVNTVSFDVKAPVNMHNGLYTISFDPAVYEPVGLQMYAEYCAVSVDRGEIAFAFADGMGFDEGGALATITLTAVADGDRTVTITTVECNDGAPGTVEYMFASAEFVHVVGSIASIGEGEVLLTVRNEAGETVRTMEISNGVYVDYLPAGHYEAILTKDGHKPATFEFDAGEDVFFEVKLIHFCDVNADGKINVTDVTALLNALSGAHTFAADVDGDGELTVCDVTKLLDFIALN